MIVPANLKSYARIDKDLVTLGAMDKIEVWSKEIFNENEDDNPMDDEDFIAKLAEYGLLGEMMTFEHVPVLFK